MPSVSEYAAAYYLQGWAPIPIPALRKGPTFANWGEFQCPHPVESRETFLACFPDGNNVGVVLGPRSQHLVDIDLDCREAVELAPYFLPSTLCFGRAGNPQSHWLYYCQGAAFTQHKDLERDVVLEVRTTHEGKSHQTVFPGSRWQSKEDPQHIEEVLFTNSSAVLRVEPEFLHRAARRLAAAALIARWWSPGGRHSKVMGLAGGMLRDGIDGDDVIAFFEALAAIGLDLDGSSASRGSHDAMRAVKSTVRAFEAGRENLVGWQSLVREGFLTPPLHKLLRGLLCEKTADDKDDTALIRQALEGVVLPPSIPASASAASGTERVSTEMLKRLAGRLERSREAGQQTVGRALLQLARGERWVSASTSREQALEVVRQIADAIGESHPYGDPEAIARQLTAGLEAVFGETAPFVAALQRKQAELRAAAERKTALIAAARKPLVLQRGTQYWLRRADGETYSRAFRTEELRPAMRAHFPDVPLPTNEAGLVDVQCALNELGVTLVDDVEFDYREVASTVRIEDGRVTLCEGLPERRVAPRYDAEADEYLRQLSGGRQGDYDDLKDWIAANSRSYIGKPAAVLVLVGRHSVGKSVFATAMAHLWGCPTPVQMTAIVEQFQSEMLGCPLLFADEQVSAKVKEADLRELAQKRARLIERKGVDAKVTLLGCSRVVIALNDLRNMNLQDAGRHEATEALAVRLAVFDTTERDSKTIQQALEALRQPGEYDIDLARLVSHCRWIQETHVPRAQRFLGGRKNMSAALKAILSGQSGKHASVHQFLLDYLTTPKEYEVLYKNIPWRDVTLAQRDTRADMAIKGYPLFVTEGGRLWARPSFIAAALGLDEARVREALRPMQLSASANEHVRVGNASLRALELRTEGLTHIIQDLEPEALASTLAVSTESRR